jgi:hypothetical protein
LPKNVIERGSKGATGVNGSNSRAQKFDHETKDAAEIGDPASGNTRAEPQRVLTAIYAVGESGMLRIQKL